MELPAFPTAGGSVGLTQREYMAIQMMAALISHPDVIGANRWEIARDAVRCADALLYVLSEQQQKAE